LGLGESMKRKKRHLGQGRFLKIIFLEQYSSRDYVFEIVVPLHDTKRIDEIMKLLGGLYTKNPRASRENLDQALAILQQKFNI